MNDIKEIEMNTLNKHLDYLCKKRDDLIWEWNELDEEQTFELNYWHDQIHELSEKIFKMRMDERFPKIHKSIWKKLFRK